jgi:hypothetical protein
MTTHIFSFEIDDSDNYLNNGVKISMSYITIFLEKCTLSS